MKDLKVNSLLKKYLKINLYSEKKLYNLGVISQLYLGINIQFK